MTTNCSEETVSYQYQECDVSEQTRIEDDRNITLERWALNDQGKLLDINQKDVCDVDNRIKVQNATSLPYKAICRLYITNQNEDRTVGTGWLAHPNKLYTAGHCVYNHKRGGWAKSIVVVPGKSGDSEPYGQYTASAIFTTSEWKNNESQRYDMGAIKLSSNVTHNEFINPSIDYTNIGTVSGYPTDKDNALYQYRMLDMVALKDGRYFYQIDTHGGQSGSPLLKDNVNSVGIHNYGGCDNKASALYQSFIDEVNRW